jgi:hypothetical protein
MESDEISKGQKQLLKKTYESLNPLQLKQELDKAETELFKLNKEKKMKTKAKIKKQFSVSFLIAQHPNFRCTT